MAAIHLDDLTLGHGRQTAVQGLRGVFRAGGATAVVGPNGSGKSTLLSAIAGRQRPWAGAVRLDGLNAADLAYLPQDPGVDRGFPIGVEDLIALGFMRQRGLFGGVGASDRGRLAEAIAAVGLTGLERRPIASLSGGQFQRALFARLAVQDAPAILLDEPFSALDAHTTEHLVALTRTWALEGRVVIVVLHDLALARALCPQTLILARQVVAWGATEAVLTADHLSRAQDAARGWPAEDAA